MNAADDLKPAEMVMLTVAEYREFLADAATLKRRIAELELALASTQAPNCDRHASRTNPLPCPHCMADWIVSATNAYAKKDWEALRATLYRNVQAQQKHGGRSR